MRLRRRLIFGVLLVLAPWAAGAADAPPRIFLLGGSTLAESQPPSLIRGWGQAFGAHFTAPGMVQNRADHGGGSEQFQGRGAGDGFIHGDGGGGECGGRRQVRMQENKGSSQRD